MLKTHLDPQVRGKISELIPKINAQIATARRRLKERFGGVAVKISPTARHHKAFVEEAERLFKFFSLRGPYTVNTCAGLQQLTLALRGYLDHDNPDLALLTEAKQWEEFINYEKHFARNYPGSLCKNI
jgi:hypothetical protein